MTQGGPIGTRDLASVVKQQQSDLLDLALNNATHEETIARLTEELQRERATKGAELDTSRVSELMSGIEMMAGHLEEDERQRAHALQALQGSVYTAIQSASGRDSELEGVDQALHQLEAKLTALGHAQSRLQGGDQQQQQQQESLEHERLLLALVEAEREAASQMAQQQQLMAALADAEHANQALAREKAQLQSALAASEERRAVSEEETKASGLQMDKLREQLVSQFGRRAAAEIAAAAMGAGSAHPGSPPTRPPPKPQGHRVMVSSSSDSPSALLRAVALTQASVLIWRKAFLSQGFVLWHSATRNRSCLALAASAGALQQDLRIAQEQLRGVAQHQSKMNRSSRHASARRIDGIFNAAAGEALRGCFQQMRKNFSEVAGYLRGTASRKGSSIMALGGVLSNWKGRNERGKRTLAGLTRLILFTALPDMMAVVRDFSHWRVLTVTARAQRIGAQSSHQIDAAARAKTAALGTKLEVMVRQAAGVERMQSILRTSDTAAAGRFMGYWKLFALEQEYSRQAEARRVVGLKDVSGRQRTSAGMIGATMLRALRAQTAEFFRTWTVEVQERRAVKLTAAATKCAVMLAHVGPQNREVSWARWRERTTVSRACGQVAALRRVDSLLLHNTVTQALCALRSWMCEQLLHKARKLRDGDVSKVAWRYQSFGHHLVAAQLVAGFCDKVRLTRMLPAMCKWKERSFFHVVPPHRYSYQAFGRQMVGAQQVANILDRHRILSLIHALSGWSEVVFSRLDHASTFLMSPNQFVVGHHSSPGAASDPELAVDVAPRHAPQWTPEASEMPSSIQEPAAVASMDRGSARSEFEQLKAARKSPKEAGGLPTMGGLPGLEGFESFDGCEDDAFINPEEYRLFG